MDKSPNVGKSMAYSQNEKKVPIPGKWGARVRVGVYGTGIALEAFFILESN